MKIVLCTDKSAIFREYQELAKRLLPLATLCAGGQNATYTEVIAYAKAQAKHFQCPVLVEESILVVPSLAQSYPCDPCIETQSMKRKTLLHALEGKSQLDRSAYMQCMLTLAFPDEEAAQFKGICEGSLLESEEGSGYGYDPLFRKHSYNQTLAQLPSQLRAEISDRGKAFQRLSLWLESKLSTRC